MNIVHIVPVYAPAWKFGGPVQSISRICESMVAMGHKVSIITTNAGIEKSEKISVHFPVERNGVNVTYLETKDSGATIKTCKYRTKSVQKIIEKADLIHMSIVWQPWGIKLRKLAKSLDKPIIQSTRGALSEYSFSRNSLIKNLYYQIIEKSSLNESALIHVTSKAEKMEVERLRLSPTIKIVGNPIDITYKSRGIQEKIKDESHITEKSKTRRLLICGRMNRKKGLDLLPSILSKLTRYNWTLEIIGESDDESKSDLVSSFKNMKLDGRISWSPFVEPLQLSEVYENADLLLLPSRHENFGNVVIEALAHGCQVAVSNQTGVSVDLRESGMIDYGVVLERKEELWSEWMIKWFEKPLRRANTSAEWISTVYSPTAVAHQMLEMYKTVLTDKNKR